MIPGYGTSPCCRSTPFSGDIIPAYRIRVPTAAEVATKVSKDVQHVRSQEAALLSAYQVRRLCGQGTSSLTSQTGKCVSVDVIAALCGSPSAGSLLWRRPMLVTTTTP